MKIRIQPSTLPDLQSPYPYYIRENGDVDLQDVWKGDPAALIDFQDRFDVQTVDLLHQDWWRDPQRAVGKYPVFVTDQGDLYVQQIAVSDVTVIEDKEDR